MSFRNASFFPMSLAIKPTRRAAITVPSLTPSSLPANTKESTAAITAMDTSKQILVVPKFVFHVRTMARTKDSPGSITTSARTSIYTPTPRIRHPMSRYTIFMTYASGLTQEKRIMVRSIKYPNMMDTGI